MTELTFTKSYLSTLDSRPLKLQPDFISPPQSLELTHPFTLPRMPNPMRRSPALAPNNNNNNNDLPTTSTTTAAAAAAAGLTISLKSSRNPPLDLQLTGIDPSTTTILDLKDRVVEEMSGRIQPRKVKVLYARKPVSDTKTVSEAVTGAAAPPTGGNEVEFGVMIMGWSGGVPPKDAAAGAGAGGAAGKTDTEKAEGEGGRDGGAGVGVLEGKGFWVDLRGFLQQRLKDEGAAAEVVGVFEGAWKGRGR